MESSRALGPLPLSTLAGDVAADNSNPVLCSSVGYEPHAAPPCIQSRKLFGLISCSVKLLFLDMNEQKDLCCYQFQNVRINLSELHAIETEESLFLLGH